MTIWIILAALTAGALAVVLAPLGRGGRLPAERRQHDMAVYRDQLAEVDADLARGEISTVEAEAARAEIGRRLLKSADEGSTSAQSDEPRAVANGGVMLAAMAAVALPALALYLFLGTPDFPDLPHAARINTPPAESEVAVLIAKVEERLRQNPADGDGWEVIAPVYLRLGRYDDAAMAYSRTLLIKGESVERLEGFAEASVLASDGVVGETARKSFARALARDPETLRSAFWLAIAKEQDGDRVGAEVAFKALVPRTAEGSTLRRIVEERLAALSGAPAPGPGPSEAPSGGPTEEQAAAAAEMAPEDRQKMIEGMVAGLAERLKTNGRDLDGWLKLVRAYSVLGRKEAAVAALADARRNLSGDPAALTALDGLAASLGLGS